MSARATRPAPAASLDAPEAAGSWLAAGGLYAILDPDACAGRDPRGVAEAILAGGCAVLQLRWKQAPDRDRLALARALSSLCHARGVPFVVNDRPDLARLADADGLHLGQDDLAIVDARRIVGAMPIGRSTHSLDEAREAAREGADLLGFGPIFPTRTKTDAAPVVGLEALARVSAEVPRPLVAIGGVDLDAAPAVRRAGARFGAAIRAVCGADDPAAAARALHRALAG